MKTRIDTFPKCFSFFFFLIPKEQKVLNVGREEIPAGFGCFGGHLVLLLGYLSEL
jgi:hypothetical protein